jgi:Uma2 family endonuclease
MTRSGAIEDQRTFTIEEYHRMGEAGVFAADEQVELIRGVVRRMSPKGKRHSSAVFMANRFFTYHLAGRAGVFIQDAFRKMGWHSEPEPDVIVVSNPDPEAFGTERSEALLVIEVADTSLAFDRSQKAALYAEARVPEYWIVNLVDNVVEVHRDPHGDTYLSKLEVKGQDRFAPLAFPDLEIHAGDLIP